jgi:hypothetical protein
MIDVDQALIGRINGNLRSSYLTLDHLAHAHPTEGSLKTARAAVATAMAEVETWQLSRNASAERQRQSDTGSLLDSSDGGPGPDPMNY